MADIPKIRFKGFTEPWEQRKLEDFGKATGGTSIESEFSEDGVYKVISIGSYSENSVYNDQGIRAIKSDKTSNRVLNRNDLTMILNDKTTSGNIIGRVLLIEESGIYVYNQRTERIEINLDEYDPVFLYEMLNAPNIREKIIKQAQGNTQIYVNWTTISLLEYMIPSKEEQVKIGEHLHGISNLIALHQRKCDDTKELKKYMLQKMFPKNGEKFPEIRFKGFTEAWEQRKLGDLVISHNAGIYISKEDYGTGTNVIGVGNIYDNDIFDGEIYRLGPVNDEKFLLEENDLIYGESSLVPEGIARTVCVGKNGVGSAFAWHTRRVKLDQSVINSHFATLELNYNIDVRKYLISVSTQTALTGMTTEGYFGVTLSLPTVEEQAHISSLFKQLDHLITLHRRAL